MNRRTPLVVASLLVVLFVFVGCAKRPALLTASAPAPAGAAQTVAAPPAAAAETQTPAAPAPAPAPEPSAAPAAVAPAAPAPPPPKEFEPRAELSAIHFDFDKYNIRPGDAKILEANAQWLKSNPEMLLLIEGHCDERGTNEYNMALGDRRAKATMNYLVSQGVQADRISMISYGEERPLCTDRTEGCWSQNRRSELKVKPR